MNCNEVRRLVHASLDGELDLVRQMEVDAHLETCEGCRRASEALGTLRDGLQRGDLYFRAPATLERRIRTAIAGTTERTLAGSVLQHRTRRVPVMAWTTAIAAAAAIILFAASVWVLRSRPSEAERLAQESVANHIRSLLPGHLTDVASTEQHTVKPWFAGRIDFSPPVVDFAPQGFPLVGGRVDYLGGRTVAALVYRRRQHVLNLFIWPSPQESAPTLASAHGYNVVTWCRAGMAYSLVSDLNQTELRQFADLVRRTP